MRILPSEIRDAPIPTIQMTNLFNFVIYKTRQIGSLSGSGAEDRWNIPRTTFRAIAERAVGLGLMRFQYDYGTRQSWHRKYLKLTEAGTKYSDRYSVRKFSRGTWMRRVVSEFLPTNIEIMASSPFRKGDKGLYEASVSFFQY